MTQNTPNVEYCIHAIDLRWADVVWAVEKGIFGWRDVREFALFRINDVRSPTFAVENQICQLGKNEASEIMDLAREAAQNDVTSEALDRRWLYLLLKWVFDKMDAIDNPFGQVEEIYADFGYPEGMESFVPFLPPSDGWEPEKHSKAENMNRLVANWRDYLEKSARELA